MQTRLTKFEKHMATVKEARQGLDFSKLHDAQRLYRVASAVELAVAKHGARLTVAQTVAAGEMAFGTFYKCFESIEDAIERLFESTDLMCDWLARAAAREALNDVYEDYMLRFPNVECLLYALGGPRQIAGYRDTAWPHAWHMGRPRKHTDLSSVELLAWAKFVDTSLEPTADEGNPF